MILCAEVYIGFTIMISEVGIWVVRSLVAIGHLCSLQGPHRGIDGGREGGKWKRGREGGEGCGWKMGRCESPVISW